MYLLIIKKEGNVSQNTALWAKAVFLCSFEWQSVALHLRPIILHQVSETDKTYKTGDEMMTAPHCSLLCTQHLHLIWCLSRRDEKKKSLTTWTKDVLIWELHTQPLNLDHLTLLLDSYPLDQDPPINIQQ